MLNPNFSYRALACRLVGITVKLFCSISFGQDHDIYRVPYSVIYMKFKVKTMTETNRLNPKDEIISRFDTNGVLLRIEEVYVSK